MHVGICIFVNGWKRNLRTYPCTNHFQRCLLESWKKQILAHLSRLERAGTTRMADGGGEGGESWGEDEGREDGDGDGSRVVRRISPVFRFFCAQPKITPGKTFPPGEILGWVPLCQQNRQNTQLQNLSLYDRP